MSELLKRFAKYRKPGVPELTYEEMHSLLELGLVRWSFEDARWVLTDEGQRAYLRRSPDAVSK